MGWVGGINIEKIELDQLAGSRNQPSMLNNFIPASLKQSDASGF